MDYLLFTYPNCDECDKLKKYISEINLSVEEYDLTRKDSKMKIRNFLNVLKRDDKGGIIIPTLILQDGDKVAAVLNNQGELENWLRSEA